MAASELNVIVNQSDTIALKVVLNLHFTSNYPNLETIANIYSFNPEGGLEKYQTYPPATLLNRKSFMGTFKELARFRSSHWNYSAERGVPQTSKIKNKFKLQLS